MCTLPRANHSIIICVWWIRHSDMVVVAYKLTLGWQLWPYITHQIVQPLRRKQEKFCCLLHLKASQYPSVLASTTLNNTGKGVLKQSDTTREEKWGQPWMDKYTTTFTLQVIISTVEGMSFSQYLIIWDSTKLVNSPLETTTNWSRPTHEQVQQM
jgi:hypothetical protein